MRKASTLFLRLIIALFGVVILAICIYIVPKLGNIVGLYYSNGWKMIVLGCLYGAAFPCFWALYHTWNILNYIDRQEAFTHNSTAALTHIKLSAIAISMIHAMLLPFAYGIAEVEDAPGLIILVGIIPGAAMVIAVFAAVLQRLLVEALQIKQDNELTI